MPAEGEHEVTGVIGLGAVGELERLKLAREDEVEAANATRRVLVGSKQDETGAEELFTNTLVSFQRQTS